MDEVDSAAVSTSSSQSSLPFHIDLATLGRFLLGPPGRFRLDPALLEVYSPDPLPGRDILEYKPGARQEPEESISAKMVYSGVGCVGVAMRSSPPAVH
jgi:hypothetical protein